MNGHLQHSRIEFLFLEINTYVTQNDEFKKMYYIYI